MKKVVLSLVISLFSVSALLSQNYYINEDFNSGIPSSWTNTAVSGSFPWMQGVMYDVTDKTNATFDGTPMMYFNDDSLGGAHLNNTAEIVTPVVTPLVGFPLTLEFDYNFRHLNKSSNYFKVEIHDGTAWTVLLNVTSDDCGRWIGPCVSNQRHANINLDAYVGLPLKLRFTYSDGNNWSYWAAFDNVKLWSPYNHDLKMLSINTPFSNCGLAPQEVISVTFKNIGFSKVGNFPISYTIDNANLVTETIADSIKPDSTYTYTFIQRGNFSTIQAYDLKVFTGVSNDLDRSNDTLKKVVENIAPVTPDYSQDFETGANDWAIYGTNSSIQVGTPSGAVISSAHSGTGAAVSNLSGQYNNNELSYLQTPCMDFGTLPGAPIMSFDLKLDLDNGDKLYMEQSSDAGATWNRISRATNSNNFYNNSSSNSWIGKSSGWLRVDNVLTSAYRSNTKNELKFRFVLETNGSGTAEGFAVDNFSIKAPQPDDVKLKDIISPDNSSTCGFRNGQDIIVEVFNQGSNPVTSIIFNWQITAGPNGPSAVHSDTSVVSIAPNSPYLLVHNAGADLGEVGSYSMDFWIEAPNDGNKSNDSILNYSFDHIAINSLSEDFSSFVDGSTATGKGWTSSGTNGYVWKIQSRDISASPSGPDRDRTGNMNGNGKYAYTDVPPFTGVGEIATFTSPCVNLGMTDGAVISYWYHKYGSAMGDLFVEVFDPLSKTWVALNSIYGSTHMSKGEDWLLGTARITTPYSSQVRFRGYSRGYPTGNMAIDDIDIFPPEEMDGMIRNVLEPVSGCNLKNDEKFTVEIGNFGKHEIDTVPIAYWIDDGTQRSPIYRDTAFAVGILPGAILTYTFANLLDLSKYDNRYTIKLWVEIPRDGRHSNDTILLNVVNETQNFPYLETFSDEVKLPTGKFRDFGYFESFFKASPISEDLYSWRLEDFNPPANDGSTHDHTSVSGLPGGPHPSIYMVVNSAKANPMGQQVANLISPCIDLNNVPAANLEFWYHMNKNDKHTLHIDVHNGSYWEDDVFVMNETFDQLFKTSPWIKRVVTLSKYTGNFVQVRFRGVSPQGSMGPSFSIDDVGVVLPPPQQVAVDTVVTPDDGRCNYWPNEDIRVLVRNVGLDNLDSLVMGYKVQHPTLGMLSEVIDTVVFSKLGKLPIAPGDTRTVAYPTVLDMSAFGKYTIIAFMKQPGDLNPLDDTFRISATHPTPVNLPYIVDFENVSRGKVLQFPPINWYASNVHGFEWESDDVDTEPGTGPTYDHTKRNAQGMFLVTKPQPSPPFAPSGNGEYAVVVTPCVSLPDVNHAFMEYYYHRYGVDLMLGDMKVDIYDDSKWIQIDRINGMTQINKGDNWLRSKIDLHLYDHQKARFRFRASHHGINSHTGLDDIYIGSLPEYDLAVDSIVSPSGKADECYSTNSTMKVRFKNKGVYNLDFSVDTLTLTAEIFVGGVLKDSQTKIVSSNIFNRSGLPLKPDSTVVIPIDSLDLSEYGVEHTMKITTSIGRDDINLFNNTMSSKIIPIIKAGVMSVEPVTICRGEVSMLKVRDYRGSLEWQYRRELPTGVIWSPVFPLNGTRDLLVRPNDTTWYRLQYCNATNSDSILLPKDSIKVNVINSPAPQSVLDTVCEAGQISLSPPAHSSVDTLNWYRGQWDKMPFLQKMTYTGYHEIEPDTFYVESVVNGCKSARVPMYAVVAPYPVINLGPDTTICPDSLYYFNAGGGKDYEYEWKRTGDPRPYDSLDNAAQIISINPYEIMKLDSTSESTTISLSVIVTSPYNCVSYDTVSITVLHSSDTSLCVSGIDELSMQNAVRLTPNPSSGNVQLTIDLDESHGKASYEIYSIDGKMIIEREKIPSRNYVKNMDLSKLPNGIYFVKLITDKGSVVKKLVLTN